MRRNRVSQCHPVNRRAGVNMSVKTRNHNAQSPLSTMRCRYGCGPRWPSHASRAKAAAGTTLHPNTAGFRMMRIARVEVMSAPSRREAPKLGSAGLGCSRSLALTLIDLDVVHRLAAARSVHLQCPDLSVLRRGGAADDGALSVDQFFECKVAIVEPPVRTAGRLR